MPPANPWNEKFRAAKPTFTPLPLLVEAVRGLQPGLALDLACGTGRHALYLAQNGWRVTAVDSSPIAIDILRAEAIQRNVVVETLLNDLEENTDFIGPAAWDFIAACCYLQRNLFEVMKRGTKPGGVVVASVLLRRNADDASPFRAASGELRNYFANWEILHDHESAPGAAAPVAEIIARRPRA